MGRTRGYDPALDSAILLGLGAAHAVSGPDETRPEPAGRLVLPDPEQRGGWREHYVQKPVAEKPGRRPLGFARPEAR